MAPAIFLLPLLFAAYFSQNEIRNESELSTNISLTSNVCEGGACENEIQSMIEQQSALCPYIRLCTHANRSTETFIANQTGEFPCCSECSCKPSCIAERTCCPDFNYEDITGSRTASVKQSGNTSKKRKCVKSYYGTLYRKFNGYKMIASCKTNFTDNSTKYLCEKAAHIKDRYSFVFFFPVYHKENGNSYKNIFCYLCNGDNNQSPAISFLAVSFWDTYLHCSGQTISLRNIELDPFHFGKTLLQHSCSIEFKKSIGSESNLEACKVGNDIESCLVEHADTKLESLCKLYSWPITSKSTGYYSTYESFKNLACVLCNDRIVSNTCFEVSPKKPTYTVLLTKADPSTVTLSLTNGRESDHYGNQIFLNRTIKCFFPDSKGNVLCEKGFIFDDEKNECRQVFCPNFFFLDNGSCSLILNQTKGLYYYHLYQVIVPTSVYGVDSDRLEEVLFFSLNQRLQQQFDNGSYDLFLWCNKHSRGKMNMDRKYVTLIVIGNEFKYMSYTDVLGVFYWIARHNILTDIKENSKNIYAGIQLQFSSRYVYILSKVKRLSGGTLFLRRSTNKKFRDFDNKMFEISVSHLCYRALLNVSEINGNTLPNAIRVVNSDKLLFVPNVQVLRTKNDMRYMVCLENVLSRISEASKYIYHIAERTNKSDINRGDTHGKSTGEKGYILTEVTAVPMERSVAILVATAVFALVLVGIRIFLKRLRRIDF